MCVCTKECGQRDFIFSYKIRYFSKIHLKESKMKKIEMKLNKSKERGKKKNVVNLLDHYWSSVVIRTEKSWLNIKPYYNIQFET